MDVFVFAGLPLRVAILIKLFATDAEAVIFGVAEAFVEFT